MISNIQIRKVPSQKVLNYAIRKADIADISALVYLGAITLGEGYLTPQRLRRDITEQIGHVAVHEQKIVGYCISECLNPQSLKGQLLGHPQDEFIDLVRADKRGTLGLIQSVGVDPTYRKMGIASQMVQSGMADLKFRGIETIMALAWKTDTIHIGGVLTKLGFSARKQYEEFWSEQSIQYNFKCPVCGLPPCRCSAVLFSYSSTEDKPGKSICVGNV